MSIYAFIDSRVPDYERLIAGLDSGVQAVVLDPTQDGVTQIAAALAGVTDLDSIHIISHGASGTLYLGSIVLSEDNLDDYKGKLTAISEALSEEGDILLYGCSVGAGTTGESFIASLAEYTGADVAASDDTIRLDNDIFTAFVTENVGLAGNAFYAGVAAHDATDRIIYDAGTGNLYYDADGTGAAAAKLFATLTGAPAVTAADFFVMA